MVRVSQRYAKNAGIVIGILYGFYKNDKVRTYIYINKEWLLICVLLLCIFYFFSSPFFGKSTKPSYSIFNLCYIVWILVATLYHLPIFQSTRMYLSLFFTYYISTFLYLFVIYIGRWYIGLVAGMELEIWTIIQKSTFLSAACCTFYLNCAEALKQPSSDWFFTKYDQICSSDRISPIYSSWIIVIGLHMVTPFIRALIQSAVVSAEENDRQPKKPKFLDMVTWHSVALYKTVFDSVVSKTLFMDRFDMRMMQAAMIQKDHDGAHEGGLFYYQFKEEKDLWFDFMADTGDGGSSSYAVAKLLAKPSIDNLVYEDSVHNLSRGDLLLIGGDLAYPNPSPDTYEKRFLYPFQEALQPPPNPESPYDGPQCFIIPGNHDWFDGLHTFMKYICHKSWLGGWFLPQKKSYFALQLPKGWWVFGLDQALDDDIDEFQFKFFAELIENKVEKNDSVIIMTHEPNWLSDWYLNKDTGKNVSDLIKDHLKGRCKLRMAGDLHHYMRHSSVPSDNPAYVPHLLINGCGGAFLHPTHVFKKFKESNGTTYKQKAVYPSIEDSYEIARENIFNFRKKNWQFDFIGGIIYFILAFSLFPQCDDILQNDSFSGFVKSFFGGIGPAFMYVFQESYTSLAGTLLLLFAAYKFVPSKLSRKSRLVIGILHVSAHLVSALILMLLLELGIELFIRHGLVATSDHHTLYEWYRSVVSKHFPDTTRLWTRIEGWTYGLYPGCLKYLMSSFDIPEVMAVTRNNICQHGIQSLSRGNVTRNNIWNNDAGIQSLSRRSTVILYYASVFIYYWILSTPVVSRVYGFYLYLCINRLDIHFDEAFSSLHIADYKAFTRFHITKDGDLDVFTLAVDKVPQDWKLDSKWFVESREQPQMPSHHRRYPSKWTACMFKRDPFDTVKIVDHFTIKHTEQDDEAVEHV